MSRFIVFLISLYQATASPDHGPGRVNRPHGSCRYYPTCSEYTKQSVQRFGAGRGLWYGLRRLIRCHPWSPGGVDLVPTN